MNTMIGSTILTMPWGMQEAGLIPGLLLIVVVGVMATYTCWLITLNSMKVNADNFGEVVYLVWGKRGQ